jgi:hypothetical protein
MYILCFNSQFLMFVNLSGVTFKQCHFHVDSSAENFTQLQIAIPASLEAIRRFAAQSEAQRCRLRACHERFWDERRKRFPGTNSLQHEGYLWRKGSGFTKSWLRRYFRITNYKLCYLQDGNGNVRGEVDLLTTSVKPVPDPDRRNCFTVISPDGKKTYVLQAMTPWDMEEWIAVTQNNVQYLLDHVGEAESMEGTTDTAVDPREHNQFCADCHAPDPSWCCINWATCICIKCSGVHREMSIAVSKVRSLTLDHLHPKLLELFALIGNDVANSILEKEMPDDARIDEAADRTVRDAFLRRKYEKCEFVDVTDPVDVAAAIRAADMVGCFRGLCQMRKKGVVNHDLLKLAASLGNVSVCLLVGLNSSDIDALDKAGWSALSYAAYYGQIEAAEALMMIGCRPEVAADAHPYEIAMSRKDGNMASVFQPYWRGTLTEGKQFVPSLRIDAPGPEPEPEPEAHAVSESVPSDIPSSDAET